MKASLIIKGEPRVALLALAMRGLHAREYREVTGRDAREVSYTVAYVDDVQNGTLIHWMGEEPRKAPYPAGALLLWTELN